MSDIASYISMDQMMTSRVLSWANSAYYGLPSTVTTVHQATMYLGQVTVRSIVLTACVSTYLSRALPGYGMKRGDLWMHSIGVAAGARQITAKFGKTVGEDAYFAGLLCDIGKLAFEVVLRNTDFNQPDWQGKSFDQVETEQFGINHAILGGLIAKKWMLPDSICNVITNHHQPAQAKTQEQVLASAVHVADLMMMMSEIGNGVDRLRYQTDPLVFKVLQINEADLPGMMENVTSYVRQTASELGLEDF
jgi:HD-like signal output (HDOD) protein